MDEVIWKRINEIRLMAHRLGEKFPKTKQPEHMWYSDDVRFLLAQLDACEKDNERLRERLNACQESKAENYIKGYKELQQQNTILREALERVDYLAKYYSAKLSCHYDKETNEPLKLEPVAQEFADIVRETLAKVSQKEVSTPDEPNRNAQTE